MSNNLIIDFVRLHRQHLIDSMQIQNLPKFWDKTPEIYERFGMEKPVYDEETVKRLTKPRKT